MHNEVHYTLTSDRQNYHLGGRDMQAREFGYLEDVDGIVLGLGIHDSMIRTEEGRR